MQTKEIKISNELMDAIVISLFETKTVLGVEPEWPLEINRPKSMPQKLADSVLDISQEDIDTYFDKFHKAFDGVNTPQQPYFSLVSDNATNDLQIYIQSLSDGKITCKDIRLYSEFYIKEDDKYIFYNRDVPKKRKDDVNILLKNIKVKKAKKVPIDKDLEKRMKEIDFIKVAVKIDMTEAEKRYNKDFKNNVGGIADAHISFNQWLSNKQIAALAIELTLI